MSVAIVLGQLERNRWSIRPILLFAIGLLCIAAMPACQSDDDDTTSDDDTGETRHVSTTGDWMQVSVFASHSCGLRNDGSVVCWGASNYHSMFDDVVGPFVQISTNLAQICGVTEQGDIECWGCDDEEEDGQCENAPPGYAGRFIWTAAGDEFSAGLLDTGTLLAWGCPGSGSGSICSQTPVDGYATMIDADGVLCGIHEDGSIQCVNSNAIASVPGFVQMDIRYANDLCAVGVDGKAYSIGNRSRRYLLTGDLDPAYHGS